jgi:hypothetical protein
MITELNCENCWSLAHHKDESVLVAYLSRTASSKQLKALIELSGESGDVLRIYVTHDLALQVSSNAAEITGTPTYLLIRNAKEQRRLLGEADAQRLKKFVAEHIEGSASRVRDDSYGTRLGMLELCGSESAADRFARECGHEPGK